MRFAITGATGLLGANLSNSLISLGHSVNVLIKDEQSNQLLSQSVFRTYGDVSIKSDVDYFIQKTNPNVFIHLAAQTQAFQSLKYPHQTFVNNILGTLNILEGLREYGSVDAVIVASSDKAYGELTTEQYFEDHPLNGRYPYDASKSAAEMIVHSYRATYNLPVTITRACNIYGIGDYNHNRLIPGVILAHLNKTTFILRNGGTDIREYIHVDDVVNAYLNILDLMYSGKTVDAFNISSGDVYSTKQLFDIINEELNNEVKFSFEEINSLEIRKQIMNSSRLRELTNWKPTKSFKTEIPKIVKWYSDQINFR